MTSYDIQARPTLARCAQCGRWFSLDSAAEARVARALNDVGACWHRPSFSFRGVNDRPWRPDFRYVLSDGQAVVVEVKPTADHLDFQLYGMVKALAGGNVVLLVIASRSGVLRWHRLELPGRFLPLPGPQLAPKRRRPTARAEPGARTGSPAAARELAPISAWIRDIWRAIWHGKDRS